MTQTDEKPLLKQIDEFLEETGMAETTFGKKSVNDGKFVGRLREGKRVWPETADKATGFIAAERARRESENPPETGEAA